MMYTKYVYYFRSLNPQKTGIRLATTMHGELTLNQTKLGYPRDLWDLYDIKANDWTWYYSKDKCGYCVSEVRKNERRYT